MKCRARSVGMAACLILAQEQRPAQSGGSWLARLHSTLITRGLLNSPTGPSPATRTLRLQVVAEQLGSYGSKHQGSARWLKGGSFIPSLSPSLGPCRLLLLALPLFFPRSQGSTVFSPEAIFPPTLLLHLSPELSASFPGEATLLAGCPALGG